MGKSERVGTVKQFEQKSAYSTDSSSRIVIEPDENVLLSLGSVSALQISSGMGGWEKGEEPYRLTPTDPMSWSLYVTDKRIILWAPETITVMGGVKMKSGCATASVIYYEDLESVTLESVSVDSYSFSVYVSDVIPFLSAFEGSRDIVEQIAREICNAWMGAVYIHDYDAVAREQTNIFLEQSWDKVQESGVTGVGLEKNKGSLVLTEAQESDIQQAAALQSKQGSGLTLGKIYGYVIVALAVVGTIMGLSAGEGKTVIGGLVLSLYGVYLIRGGSWIIW